MMSVDCSFKRSSFFASDPDSLSLVNLFPRQKKQKKALRVTAPHTSPHRLLTQACGKDTNLINNPPGSTSVLVPDVKLCFLICAETGAFKSKTWHKHVFISGLHVLHLTLLSQTEINKWCLCLTRFGVKGTVGFDLTSWSPQKQLGNVDVDRSAESVSL